MKISELKQHVEDYLDFYGDQNVLISNRDKPEVFRIVGFDAWKNLFQIDVESTEKDEENED